MYTRAFIAFFVLASLAGIGNIFLQKQFFAHLKEQAGQEFENGNYLASLAGYSAVKTRALGNFGKPHPEVEQKIEESKNLLVAEINFEKAQKAAGEGNWLEAKALLNGDAAMINTSFARYKEAIDLFLQASEKVQILEQKIDSELKKLKIEAVEEKKRRESAETETAETQARLQTTIAEKTKTENALRSEIEERTLQAEESKAEAEAERAEKFKNEINVYVQMLLKGVGYINDAFFEIENGKDAAALLFVSQGKALFDETSVRGKEFLKKTSDEQIIYAQKLLQAASLLIDAARRTGSIVFYIGKENESEFEKLKSEITERKNTAIQIIQEIQNFVR